MILSVVSCVPVVYRKGGRPDCESMMELRNGVSAVQPVQMIIRRFGAFNLCEAHKKHECWKRLVICMLTCLRVKSTTLSAT